MARDNEETTARTVSPDAGVVPTCGERGWREPETMSAQCSMLNSSVRVKKAISKQSQQSVFPFQRTHIHCAYKNHIFPHSATVEMPQ